MFHKIRRNIAATLFLAPCALSLSTASLAQNIFLPNDTTLDATNHVDPPFSATVGWASFDDEINGVNPTSPTINIVTGASVNQLEVENSSIINMSGGNVGSGDFLGRLRSSDTSTVNISGGNILFDLDVQSMSTANFSGGTIVDDIVSHDTTTVNMSGGIVDQDLLINDSSTFNLSGGSILDDIFVQDSSLLNIFGAGLDATLLDPDFEGFYSEYSLSGQLQDSTDLGGRTFFVQNGSGARFALIGPAPVPEPGAVGLLLGIGSFGGSMLLRRRKQTRQGGDLA